MSVEQFVLFDLARLPTVNDVQAAANRLGYTLKLEPFDWRSHAGFLPAKLDDVDTGFEVYLDTLAEHGGLPEGIEPIWTHSCVTRTGGDLREGLTATIFLRAFIECAGGGYWCPDDQLYYHPGSVAAFLDDQIAEFKRFLPRSRS